MHKLKVAVARISYVLAIIILLSVIPTSVSAQSEETSMALTFPFYSNSVQCQSSPGASGSAQTNADIPIPENPPIVDNTGLENASIPADRLTDMNTIPNITVTGSNLIRNEIVPNLTKLAADFKAKFNRDLHVWSGYRDLAQQQSSIDTSNAQGRPNASAPLGQSSHGWGLAVDIEQNVLAQDDKSASFNSEEYKWLASEAVAQGWKNPYYQNHGGLAEDEPWHWEYGTTNTWGAGTNGQTPSTGSNLGCSCGGSLLSGSDNKEKIWNFLISKGLSTVQAAGAMGNLQVEGGFEPKQLEIAYSDEPHLWEKPLELPPVTGPQGQPGLGIVQWTSVGRKEALLEAAKNSTAQSVIDLSVQLDFMWTELNSSTYKSVALDPILASDDLAEVVRIWQDHYEVGHGFAPRYEAAQNFLAQYGSGASSSSSSSGSVTCSTGGSGQVVGEFSLPVDRKWYDEHKDWFTKPHHDYSAADIPVPRGTPVYAVTGGKIILAPNEGGFGKGVTIDTADGIRYEYGHGIDGGSIEGAKQGDEVQAGQLLMHVNDTGSSEGDHLHFEITINGVNYCPQNLFVGIAEGNIPDIRSLPTSGCSY